MNEIDLKKLKEESDLKIEINQNESSNKSAIASIFLKRLDMRLENKKSEFFKFMEEFRSIINENESIKNENTTCSLHLKDIQEIISSPFTHQL